MLLKRLASERKGRYEQLKAATIERKARCAPSSSGAVGVAGELTPVEVFVIGAVAQGVAGLLTNPADVLKTRVQTGAAVGSLGTEVPPPHCRRSCDGILPRVLD